MIKETIKVGKPLNVPRIIEGIIGLNEYINKWKKIGDIKYGRSNNETKVSEVRKGMVATETEDTETLC